MPFPAMKQVKPNPGRRRAAAGGQRGQPDRGRGGAPHGARGLTMGLWFLTIFFGNLLSGWIGGLWSFLSPASFFALISLIAALGGLSIMIARLWLDDALD